MEAARMRWQVLTVPRDNAKVAVIRRESLKGLLQTMTGPKTGKYHAVQFEASAITSDLGCGNDRLRLNMDEDGYLYGNARTGAESGPA